MNEEQVGRVLTQFSLESAPGNERLALERVGAALAAEGFSGLRLEAAKTAVAEAAMNAMEHGNHYATGQPIEVTVTAYAEAWVIAVGDHSGQAAVPRADPPDLEAKLAGAQPPRGWGLFLIDHLADAVHERQEGERHIMELVYFAPAGGSQEGER